MADIQLSPGWATYLRVSDEDKQSPERSFAMQRKSIQDQLLDSSELPIFKEYYDILSGSNPNRKDYRLMLDDAEAGRFSHLALYRADRFGRDAGEGLHAAKRLITLGVKVRVASMPSLMPETPDGSFFFHMMMGMGQLEVDVLRQRTGDGMEAKLRAGGWAHGAPEGYVNKEKLIKKGKYDRWVEQDPIQIRMIRDAWDLLLTDRYTLAEICEELNARGHIRRSGRPWAWDDPKKGYRCNAKNQLQRIFHNPFYVGWVTSERFGIAFGEIRGNWKPIISTEEFHRGIEILRKNDQYKSRKKRCFYLLRGLLWVQVDGKQYKLYGSTPSGKLQSYSYYRTHAKPDNETIRIQCKTIDEQIPRWLQGLSISGELIPEIRNLYKNQISTRAKENQDEKIKRLRIQRDQLRDEEANLARLLITKKISEATFDKLCSEWRAKQIEVELAIRDLEKDSKLYLDDLDVGLALLSSAHVLFDRLEEKKSADLLQILAKRIIVDAQGELIAHELHSPFAYLDGLVEGLKKPISNNGCSRWVTVGTPTVTRTPPCLPTDTPGRRALAACLNHQLVGYKPSIWLIFLQVTSHKCAFKGLQRVWDQKRR